jgi:hypothetical protein
MFNLESEFNAFLIARARCFGCEFGNHNSKPRQLNILKDYLTQLNNLLNLTTSFISKTDYDWFLVQEINLFIKEKISWVEQNRHLIVDLNPQEKL